ncbi:hypothetical protein FDV58_28985 [Bradyrhizobium elkanii]|uniref:UmuC domain-containing protein n=1 Tax=Bradyrhizobium elkanii TaxID=29448 RepID=A0A4U6RSM8_BRAEL|nr:hypothetical protein [Bradyrhizobium sp. BR2003]TKV77899.1 hypothetical protein FDV58_28985 [Bradyrhizobium elkanii]
MRLPRVASARFIHIDMDAFHAPVEHRDNPNLHGKPAAVGGLRDDALQLQQAYVEGHS